MTSATTAFLARLGTSAAAITALAVASAAAAAIHAGTASTTPGTTTTTSSIALTACGDVARARSNFADNHGHPNKADRLEDRADRRADRQDCN